MMRLQGRLLEYRLLSEECTYLAETFLGLRYLSPGSSCSAGRR